MRVTTVQTNLCMRAFTDDRARTVVVVVVGGGGGGGGGGVSCIPISQASSFFDTGDSGLTRGDLIATMSAADFFSKPRSSLHLMLYNSHCAQEIKPSKVTSHRCADHK